MIFGGTLNGVVFEYYVSEVLAAVLRAGDVLVLDNLSVHKVVGVLLPLLSMGVVVVYLPKYLSDLCPIELVWSKMKTMLRKLKSKTEKELQVALLSAFKWISEKDISNYFKHCICLNLKSKCYRVHCRVYPGFPLYITMFYTIT